MYGLVPDCTIHFLLSKIPSEQSERGTKYVAPFKLPDRLVLTFLVLPYF